MNIDELFSNEQTSRWLQENHDKKVFQSVLHPYHATTLYKETRDIYLMAEAWLFGVLTGCLLVVLYPIWFILHLWPFTSFHNAVMMQEPASTKLMYAIFVGSFIILPILSMLIRKRILKREFESNKNLWERALQLQEQGLKSWLQDQHHITVSTKNLSIIAEKILLNDRNFALTDAAGSTHQLRTSVSNNAIPEWSILT